MPKLFYHFIKNTTTKTPRNTKALCFFEPLCLCGSSHTFGVFSVHLFIFLCARVLSYFFFLSRISAGTRRYHHAYLRHAKNYFIFSFYLRIAANGPVAGRKFQESGFVFNRNVHFILLQKTNL